MKVLFVSSNLYFPDLLSGTETSTHETCRHLPSRGVQPFVLAALKPRGMRTTLLRVRRHLLREEFPADRGPGYPVFRVWQPHLALGAVARKIGADAIVIMKNNRALVEAAASTGLPCFMHLHDVQFVDLRDFHGLTYIANSQFTASRLKHLYGLDSVVMPPWVNRDHYRTQSTREWVLFVNPDRNKGVDVVFDLARARPDIPFVMLESWPLQPDARARYLARMRDCPNLCLKNAVLDMRTIYRRTRILLVPSLLEEAWGRVATEAHTSGIPVIASNRGGLPEAVGPGGILVDPAEGLPAWQAALSRLWDSAEDYQRYSASSLAHSLREEIAPDHMLDRFIAVLQAGRPLASDGGVKRGV
jgi:glycosyltransferase involved in cell wall biosynthesis